jgi:DNA-binding protein Fis
MDPETKKKIKEWRENMEQAQAMEFALVAEEQYKNARDVKKIREEMKQQLKEYFKNEKDDALE